MLALINGVIITKDNLITNHALILNKDKICDILPLSEIANNVNTFDCQNRYILPGLIDTHCDSIENQIVPRKGIIFDSKLAIVNFDKQLLGNGITTMYHAISIANSTIANKRRTLTVEQQLDIGNTINLLKKSLIIDHKFHARLELNTIEAVEIILRMINKGYIDELSFMDHTPGQGQYTDFEMFKLEIEKQYGSINDNEKNKIINQCIEKKIVSKEQIVSIINNCKKYNIPIAYHDVDSPELSIWIKNNGFSICEFPITKEAAIQAHKLNLHIIVGAPNILHGKSHNGNLSAIDLLKDGIANIMCSDYYSISMLPAIFKLQKYGISLPEAVKFCTYYPAIAMNLNDRGVLMRNKKADIIIVDCKNNIPVVTETFINGMLRYKAVN